MPVGERKGGGEGGRGENKEDNDANDDHRIINTWIFSSGPEPNTSWCEIPSYPFFNQTLYNNMQAHIIENGGDG